jgi:hypothetical protein
MDDHTKDSKKSPIYMRFQLLVIGIESYLENLIQNNINCHTNKGGDFLAIAFLSFIFPYLQPFWNLKMGS